MGRKEGGRERGERKKERLMLDSDKINRLIHLYAQMNANKLHVTCYNVHNFGSCYITFENFYHLLSTCIFEKLSMISMYLMDPMDVFQEH